MSFKTYADVLGIDQDRIIYASSEQNILYKAKDMYVVDWMGRLVTDSMIPHGSYDNILPSIQTACGAGFPKRSERLGTACLAHKINVCF